MSPPTQEEQLKSLDEQSKELSSESDQTHATLRQMMLRNDELTGRISDLWKAVNKLSDECERLKNENAADLERFTLRSMREFVHGYTNAESRIKAIISGTDKLLAMHKEIQKLEAEKSIVYGSIGDCLKRLKGIASEQTKLVERWKEITGSAPQSAK